MSNGHVARRKSLNAIAERISVGLGQVGDDLMEAADEAATVVRNFQSERVRVQQVIDHFAVGSLLAEVASGREVNDPAAHRVNSDAIRRDVESLDDAIAHGQLLLGYLLAMHQTIRNIRSSIETGSWDAQPDGSDEIRLRQATLAAREDERGRLAREIHDGPAQVLANAIFALEIAEQISRRDPTRVPDELNQLRGLLKDGVGEMRRFMSDLRPAMLTDRGLVPTLQRYVSDYNRFFGKNIVLATDDVPDNLSSDQQLTMFRVVQESLQNVQKHAATQNGMVELHQTGGAFVLTVSDAGRGFDPGSPPLASSTSGAGLHGMRERARLIGADLRITSIPGQGSTVELRLPLSSRHGSPGTEVRTEGDPQ